MLTGLLECGLPLLLGMDPSRRFAGAIRRNSKDWVPHWGLGRWVGVHLLTVPANPQFKSKMFVKSRWPVATASDQGGNFAHFLQKLVNRESAALRHQARAGRQQANDPGWVQPLGPQPG